MSSHESLLTRMLLLSMAVCSFAIGTTEFVTTGLLPDLAHHFSISIPQAGFVTSGYALGVGIGGPILTAATIQVNRKIVLLSLLALFILGSIVSAVAVSFDQLMVGRFLSAFCHGAFFGIGSVVVTSMAGPSRGASAIAMMFAGLTLANVLGVPFGTWIGLHFGWRTPFWLIALMGAVGFIGLLAYLPREVPTPKTHLGHELAVFKRVQVWCALFITAIGFGGLLASFAYIAPMMTHLAGYTPKAVAWLLCLYGCGLVVGNMAGGKAADKALMPTIYGLLIGLIILLVLFTYTAHFKIPAAINLFLLGAIGFGLVSPLQKYILNKAEGAPTLASTANIAAFNLGTALGVYLGGLTIHLGWGFASPSWVGAGLSFIGLIAAFVSNKGRVK